MRLTRLGNSGPIVTRMALGTMTFNLGGGLIPGIANVGQDEATRMVHCALDHGVKFFDSADGYSQGAAAAPSPERYPECFADMMLDDQLNEALT